jgi:hypothetical protein
MGDGGKVEFVKCMENFTNGEITSAKRFGQTFGKIGGANFDRGRQTLS